MPDISPRHATALALADQGIPVFPCRVGGKLPVTAHGFEDATTNRDTINGWWAEADYNVAIEPERAGWCVIDIDGKEGMDTWRQLTADHPVPQTHRVETPSGGIHLYFEGTLPPSVRRLGPGIDTRGAKSYVLIPPSIASGKSYTVGSDADVAPLPDWIAPLLAQTKAVTLTAEVAPLEAEYRGREYLKACVAAGEVSIEGRGGSARLYETCCALVKDLGCSEEMALALLQEVFNPACRPPWDDFELGVHIGNASRYGQNGAGAYAGAPAADTFASIIAETMKRAEPGAPAAAFPDPIKLGDIPGEEQAVEMVVGHWVQKRKFNVFRGRGGANKSRLALQWAMLVDAGAERAGFTVDRATAVYISCEDDREEVKRRRNAIAKKLDLPASGVLYFDMTDEDNAFLMVCVDGAGVRLTDKWHDLERRLMAIEGHKLVVLDSTYDVIDFEGSTKNSDNHVKRVITLFDRLCRKCDTTFICLWHPSRAGMGRGDEGGFATAWDNAPRNAISIKPAAEENVFELRAEKRNNLAMGQPLLLRWDAGAMVPIAGDEANAIMEHDAVVEVAILAATAEQPLKLRDKPVKWVLDDIASRVGRRLSVQAIRDHLHDECRRENARMEYHPHDPAGHGGPAGWFPKRPAQDPTA